MSDPLQRLAHLINEDQRPVVDIRAELADAVHELYSTRADHLANEVLR